MIVVLSVADPSIRMIEDTGGGGFGTPSAVIAGTSLSTVGLGNVLLGIYLAVVRVLSTSRGTNLIAPCTPFLATVSSACLFTPCNEL